MKPYLRPTIFTAVFLLVFLNVQSQSTWTELGIGPLNNTNGFIDKVLPDNYGNLYISGNFNQYNQNILRWNGSSWSTVGDLTSMGHGSPYSISSMAVDAAGNLYAPFDGNGGPNYVAKWDGSSWTNLGNYFFNYTVNIVATDNAGNVYASGLFYDANNKNYVAKWDHLTNTWSELGTGSNALNPTNIPNGGATLKSIVVDNSGNVYAAGHFRNNNGNGSFYVAKWDGTTWTELGGTNSLNANGTINDLKIDAEGNIYAAGDFTDIYGSTGVAKWNHTTNTWSMLGILNSNTTVESIALDANGVVYAPVYQYYNLYPHVSLVARYNSSNNTWTEVDGSSNFFSYNILALATDAMGHLYAGGAFRDASGNEFVAGITVSGVLPVRLTSFAAKKENNAIICNWQTSREANMERFIIQRSVDGRRFINIGMVNASINSTSLLSYSFTDTNARGQNSLKLYYRLQMMERDASFSYSPVALVEWSSKIDLLIYPVPVKDVLKITVNSSSDRNIISILDAAGRVILRKENVQKGQALEWNTSQWKAGVYFLHVDNEKEVLTKAFTKQ